MEINGQKRRSEEVSEVKRYKVGDGSLNKGRGERGSPM